jgi:hypothetical protein
MYQGFDFLDEWNIQRIDIVQNSCVSGSSCKFKRMGFHDQNFIICDTMDYLESGMVMIIISALA